jgi:hypothetical protein
MRGTRFVLLASFAAFVIGLPATKAGSQVSVGINIGSAPDCPYGYYDYAPYNCAPAGYYGPEWFNGGVFLGAGPWFHGPANFHGNVNNHFDPQHGYHGALPPRGAHPAPPPHAPAFHANESRDGKGHAAPPHK